LLSVGIIQLSILDRQKISTTGNGFFKVDFSKVKKNEEQFLLYREKEKL